MRSMEGLRARTKELLLTLKAGFKAPSGAVGDAFRAEFSGKGKRGNGQTSGA
jgi:hypothetical protein